MGHGRKVHQNIVLYCTGAPGEKMTLAELIAAAQGATQTSMALNEMNLAILTGYLLIAYFIGANLTLFQVSLVNTIFILSRIAGFLSMKGVMERVAYYQQKVFETNPDIPMGMLAPGTSGSIVQSIIFILITFGALVFMWQVRHTTKE